MKQIKTILVVVLPLVVVIVIGYGLWYAFMAVLSWIAAQESQVAAAIIAFSGTVIVGIATVVVSQQRSRLREIAEAHRPKKIKIYYSFITTMIGIIRKHKGDDSKTLKGDKEIEDFFFNFTTSLVLWGSPRVLCHYATFRNLGQEKNLDIVLIVDDIIQAMRKDLGLSNWGLTRGELIKMFLTDPESLDKPLAQSRNK